MIHGLIRWAPIQKVNTIANLIILKMTFKNLVQLPFNSNFKLKFSYSTRDECILVYNKNINNCILGN